MNRSCVICKKIIIVHTLKTKYCSVCKVIEQRKRSRDWNRIHTTRKEFDLFCLECNVSLPVNSKGDKKYCAKCLRRRIIQSHGNWMMNKRKKEKLDKFYKNIRINLIQSPYLIEKRERLIGLPKQTIC